MNTNRQKPKERRAIRVSYLKQRPELWRDLPAIPNPQGRGNPDAEFQAWIAWKRRYNRTIVNALKADGLIAPTTATFDVNVPGLLVEARK